MRARDWMVALAVLAVSGCGTAPQPPTSPAGRWITASHNLVVTIGACAPALCGTVDQVLANNAMAGQGASRARPLPVGFRLVAGLRRDGDHWTGRIFNREDGRTYDCSVRALPNGTLEVRPFIGVPVLGRTQIWTRAR